MANGCGEDVTLPDGCSRDHTEVGRHVVIVQNVALYARLLVLSLLASTADATLATRAPTRAVSPMLLCLAIIVVKSDLLVSVVLDDLAHRGVGVLMEVSTRWDSCAKVA